MFDISISPTRVKITHNGRPFSAADAKAISGIRSSKKPEKGTLGYLGIGFKSIFKVSDSPEVYSNGYQFKFDRNYWPESSGTPWQAMPIWIDEPSEAVEPGGTTFIIPFTKQTSASAVLEEVKELGTELYLFLRWLKKIQITDELSGKTWSLENLGESSDNIVTLRRDGQQQRFRFFRRTLTTVPDSVKSDRLTQEYRRNVTQREIAIAFALDGEGDLAPSEAGAMYGGVYSFLPLGEARSGAKFPIQADFLVQPGRDAINYEAPWNHWLTEEVASLCKEAIQAFKEHQRWKYQILPVFEFRKSIGLESYDRLFGPKLIEPLESFLKEDPCIPTHDGHWVKPGHAVRLVEDQRASDDLVTLCILSKDQIAQVLGRDSNLKLAHPAVQDSKSITIREVKRHDLLTNESFLEEMSKAPDAPGWFRSVYLWLQKHPIYREYRRRKEVIGYHEFPFILTAKKELLKGGTVWIPDLPPADPILNELAGSLQETRSVLHPEILGGGNEQEQRELRGFLTGLTGVQLLDRKTVCRDAILPRILTTAPKPARELLLKYTRYCQQILGAELGLEPELWVLTKSGEVEPATRVLFSFEYKPEQDWETNKKYVPGLSFLSPEYLSTLNDDAHLKTWRQFFKVGGLKTAPDNGVEDFAMNYAVECLRSHCRSVTRLEKRNFGYDLEAEKTDGQKMYIEVKGQTLDHDVELTGNETEAADKYKDEFYVFVISSIPENPSPYIIRNPAAPGVGKKDKLTIPTETWKSGRWKLDTRSRAKIGILAYGSLIDSPGPEISRVTVNRIKVETPFNVEFARSSQTRSGAPTLVPVSEGGARVNALILVLDDKVSEQDAINMLWRRESSNVGSSLSYRPQIEPTENSIIIENLKDFNGIETVLYTRISANINPRTPAQLAQLAIRSAQSEAGANGKDGITYLLAAKGAGILTPLMTEYEAQILSRTGAQTLEQALEKIRQST
ncbi:MAG: DUF3883 domain-containing protein [Acidobacteria bacterium]|nr:DUF3883 domain-containing protein [Acidobacteriota bacterium]